MQSNLQEKLERLGHLASQTPTVQMKSAKNFKMLALLLIIFLTKKQF